ncbi:MAG: SUMF1/EgtB/PvdO family nonheme iron enzyme [Hyphomicrobiaceae bacterium]|nr:SUMF1/EgtB/PvdO family nonheme iron enzyme [Hyphomicrobiaceae bacterium]
MASIFLSHSSANAAQALALQEWLIESGWNEIFLDLDPERGFKAGQRWQSQLKAAVGVCEAVIFLLSPEWCASKWCLGEFLLATHLNKKPFFVIVEPTPIAELPSEIRGEWQYVDLTVGIRDYQVEVTTPTGHREEVRFASIGLDRLRRGLLQTRLDPQYFEWPPVDDPLRPPFPGLRNLEAADAGILFGRDAVILELVDILRGLRGMPPPRVLVVLGASGAGKSSLIQAGILPRLARQYSDFIPLPAIRPGSDPFLGEGGLVRAISTAQSMAGAPLSRAEIRAALDGGEAATRRLLGGLVSSRTMTEPAASPRPTVVITVDQAEELFNPEVRDSRRFISLLVDLIANDEPAVALVLVMRTDRYEALQSSPDLEGIRQIVFSLPPIPLGDYGELIRGPLRRLGGTDREIKFEPSLITAISHDITVGNPRDALPLLAFTLGQLYEEFGGARSISLENFERFGRVRGSIDTAMKLVFERADRDARIPRDEVARRALLRRGFIPWLAGLDPDTGAPRRRVARLSEIPEESRPLIDLLVEFRLLSLNASEETGERTIEVVHEALLRQWGVLQGWLAEDAGLLGVVDSIKRAARDWAANEKLDDWAVHRSDRLRSTESVLARPDLKGVLEPTDLAYLRACRSAERRQRASRTRMRVLAAVLTLLILAGGVGWINRTLIEQHAYRLVNFWPYTLSASAIGGLKPGDVFRECARDCPEMVVISAGAFTMGSSPVEAGHADDEAPQRIVNIAAPFAVSRFEVTFDDWDACVRHAGCATRARDHGWGRGRRPVIYISWPDAKAYAEWLSKQTGANYRLLTEAEWEYVARAGAKGPFPPDEMAGQGAANCEGCGSTWDEVKTAPVGSFSPNAFGLYDTKGNVWEWVEDCWRKPYPAGRNDAGAVDVPDCQRRVLRGGAWNYRTEGTRPSFRYAAPPVVRDFAFGLRLARDLR